MVGQEQVATTLKNAIRTGHLAHSFLFCGPRGVGKTTAARILAKTINCENQTDDFEACGACPSCVAFQQNSSFNIHELDAASNNSVDDIRALVDQVRFPPQTGKYKIYIIDEVHMLSAGAFNAFLKTLEEPPSYCKFILATTEKHKILPTILSRCQIFDFRRIGVETIVKHLEHICQVENIDAEEDALHIVAQKADGGMRDALSMFDRLSSFSGGKLTYASVLENLNVLDYDYHFKVTDALLSENLSLTLQLFDQVLKKGFEGDDFILGLCEHFRNLLFCRDNATVKLMEVSDNLKQRYAEQSAMALPDFLVNCLSIGNQCDIQYKSSKNKRLTVELALIKMCYVNSVVNIDAQEGSKKKLKSPSNATENNEPQQQLIKEETPKQQQPTSAQTAPPPVTRTVAPAIVSGKKNKLLTFDQLQDALNNPTENSVIKVEEAEDVYNDAVVILNQDNLIKLWDSYAATKIPDEKRGLKITFDNYKPVLNAEMGIDIYMTSETQKSQIDEVRLGLQNYIGQRVGANVEINVISDKKTENTRKPYTEKEKFERLVERNPVIKTLQQKFGLELDYQ